MPVCTVQFKQAFPNFALTLGEIKRQGISNTLLMYVGIGIGFLSTLFIQPKLLSPAEIGVTKVLYSISMLFSTLLPMGIGNVAMRYFPRFRNDDNGHNGFLGLMIGFTTIGFVVFGSVLVLAKKTILSLYVDKSPEFAQHFLWVFLLGYCLALSHVLNTFCNNCLKSTVPTFINDVFVRLMIILSIVIYAADWVNFEIFIALYVGAFVCQTVTMFFYSGIISKRNFNFKWSVMSVEENKEMLLFGAAFLLTSVSSMGLKTLDVTILAKYMPLAAVGVYGVVSVIPLFIEAPLNSLERIAAPKITEAMHHSRFVELEKIYKDSSHYLLLLGAWIFLEINLNIEDFLSLLNAEYREAASVVLILSFGNLVNMLTGVNNPFVFYSDHYKSGIAILITTLFLAIGNYIIFIPLWGLNGAAFATVLSNLIMNTAKMLVIRKRFKMLPFNSQTLKILGATALVFFISFYLPLGNLETMVKLFLRSLFVAFVYWGIVWKFYLSPDLINTATIVKMMNVWRK